MVFCGEKQIFKYFGSKSTGCKIQPLYFQTMEFGHLDLFEDEEEEEKVDAGAADR